MCAGFLLRINGINILTSEALYQACRFPGLPEAQEIIIQQSSPMAANMKSKPYRKNHNRTDWDEVHVDIMRWCLKVKLAQNFSSFAKILRSTGQKDIVEKSHKDKFWGAFEDKTDPSKLVGENVLGKLLMELREDLYYSSDKSKLLSVEPLDIPDFLLYGRPIGVVSK